MESNLKCVLCDETRILVSKIPLCGSCARHYRSDKLELLPVETSSDDNSEDNESDDSDNENNHWWNRPTNKKE
jgi:hypothetical protein